jgi:hypothetical protein
VKLPVSSSSKKQYSQNVLSKTAILADLLKVDQENLFEFVKENENESTDQLAMTFLK